ncbi:MAG: imidazoleglycerol-phosphate dehydratase [Betaproteobacteria bacterium TMED41]|nr:MAG: imidazoleglycerol-phosphate dehydratase [Betaproteobacteria bacterium TMED41]|tara:strand:- start:551 stop:1135 length:585 start_codon:yes stop_codon:yes gene_type:complete
MRTSEITRETGETSIQISLNLDGDGNGDFKTGIPFLDHMLDQIARHGMFDLKVIAHGDLEIDAHHTVEDVGITLGQAISKALGNKVGITRFGHAYAPLDEALSRTVVDISGRPGLEFRCEWKRPVVGEFDLDLIHEFFQGFVNHSFITLHIDNLFGNNAHHQCESVFKSFSRALKVAVSIDLTSKKIPSTKGIL